MSQTSDCKWPHMPPDCGCPVGGYVGQPDQPPVVGGSRDAGPRTVPQVAAQPPAGAPVAPGFNPAFAGSVNPALGFLLGGGR